MECGLRHLAATNGVFMMDWVQAQSLDWLEKRALIEPGSRPSVIAGWDFITVTAAKDPDALPLHTVASTSGPDVFYHPQLFPRSIVEDPHYVMIWLPMAINHIACSILYVSTAAADNVGEFTSDRWQNFRDFASSSMKMTWEEIVNAARLDGVAATAEYMTASLFVEEGVQNALARRAIGTPSLHLV